MAVVDDKLLMVGGKEIDGGLHTKAEYMDNGVWVPVDDNVTLSSYKLSRPCMVGWQSSGYLLGGDDYASGTVHTYIWKLDFDQSPLKWEKHSHLLNGRYSHGCAVMKVRGEPHIISAGGLSNAYETYEAKIVSSVELLNLVTGRRAFTASLPKPLWGGSLILAGTKLFYVGGVDPYGEPSDMAYEYTPRPGSDYVPENTEIRSFWKEHRLNISSPTSIALAYNE